MKPISYIVLFLVLGIGLYLNRLDPDRKRSSKDVMAQDLLTTSMAASKKRE
jgi:hypothetical protein